MKTQKNYCNGEIQRKQLRQVKEDEDVTNAVQHLISIEGP